MKTLKQIEEMEAEITALCKLVKEMGRYITAIRDLSMGKIRFDAEKIISRPEVKKILDSEP